MEDMCTRPVHSRARNRLETRKWTAPARYALIALLGAVSVPFCFEAALAAMVRVPDDAPTIQAAITAASPGDTVEVACGTYYESEISMTEGITLRSEGGNADCVRIDAEGEGRVILVDTAEPCRIEGLTISGGGGETFGGGIYWGGAGGVIINCVFENNVASRGGGVMVLPDVNLSVVNSVFQVNRAKWGGGLSGDGCTLEIVGCTFESNRGEELQLGGGAAIELRQVGLHMTDTVIRGNMSHGYGAVSAPFSGGTSIAMERCLIADNVTTGTGGDVVGGGCYFYQVVLEMEDCVVVRNECSTIGGGIYMTRSDLRATNVIVAKNDPDGLQAGGVAWLENCTFAENEVGEIAGGELVLQNSLVVNTRGWTFGTQSPPDCRPRWALCSDIFPASVWGSPTSCFGRQAGEQGNFSADPLFCDAGSGEYGLQADSPCAPEATGCGLVGARPVECGPTSLQEESWAQVKARFRR